MTDRELDALVAEKVMGLSVVGWAYYEYECLCEETSFPGKERSPVYAEMVDTPLFDTHERRVAEVEKGHGFLIGAWHSYECEVVAPYSTDISAAWQVVERMRERGWAVGVQQKHASEWQASFVIPKAGKRWCAFAEDAAAARAICLAALRALGVEVGE